MYRKAKNEPEFRFYQLYDKVYREDILQHACALAKANGGAPGVDGESFADIETKGVGEWLNGLRKDLHDKTYQAQPARRKTIPKPGGGERALGIPTIRDRVAQTAAKLILEPIWEADLEPNAYGYRPGKSAQDAIQKVNELLRAGYTDIVDADLSKYFDTIPHSELMQCVARRIVDRQMLSVTNGKRRLTGGKGNDPRDAESRQGAGSTGVDAWGAGAAGADTQRKEDEHTGCPAGRFDFLGYTFGPHINPCDGHRYIGYSPSRKSMSRIKRKVGELLDGRDGALWEEVCQQPNRKLQGWRQYFNVGSTSRAYRAVDEYVYDRVRNFLRRRHKVSSQGTRQFPGERVYSWGCFGSAAHGSRVRESTMKPD
jgi:RNA-directed DNA polymerase